MSAPSHLSRRAFGAFRHVEDRLPGTTRTATTLGASSMSSTSSRPSLVAREPLSSSCSSSSNRILPTLPPAASSLMPRTATVACASPLLSRRAFATKFAVKTSRRGGLQRPSVVYRDLTESEEAATGNKNKIRYDAMQAAAMAKLDSIFDALVKQRTDVAKGRIAFKRMESMGKTPSSTPRTDAKAKAKNPEDHPAGAAPVDELLPTATAPSGLPPGLYLYGPAGSGKSMCMDLLFHCLQAAGVKTKRQHFHEFLYTVHRELFKLRKEQKANGVDALRRFAEDLKRECDVLCFDEVAITTIQDCTILAPLLQRMFEAKICLVATSNRAPESLYEDGLNRYLYIPPLLEVLHANMDVVTVESTDYRQQKYENFAEEREGLKLFFSKAEKDEAEEFLRQDQRMLTTAHSLPIGYGRVHTCPRCSEDLRTSRFSFSELFNGPPYLGADDFNSICAQFHTIILDELPILEVADHNQAKRLCNFLDCAYEHHVKIVCVDMASSEVTHLFKNLVPLEFLDVATIIRENNKAGSGSAGAGAAGGESSGSSGVLAGSGDQDASAASSGVLSAVRAVEEVVGKQQQSCYFLSADHKDWSVESKIVTTSSSATATGTAKGAPRRGGPGPSPSSPPQQGSLDLFLEIGDNEEQNHRQYATASAIPGMGGSGTAMRRSNSASTATGSFAAHEIQDHPSLWKRLKSARPTRLDHDEHTKFNADLRTRATTNVESPSNSVFARNTTGVEHEGSAKPDMEIWKQDEKGMPQVTKSWDEKRRVSQSEWEAADPTAEQHTVKGVFVAAIASLHETGFAVKRAISRLQEMQTRSYQEEWKRRRAAASGVDAA
mmetsp:Transcript_17289/g.42980  ORF Transcript_17289/g.42980 Transcript_17289/m.42980 type:complete len:834 (+) Transcript_17289:127-2628(+)